MKIFGDKKNINKEKKGFTLLFAVLVSTLVLAVGASIISMALRQVILSGVGRDSQFAFYASNTGIECALYWDLNSSFSFATSTDTPPSNGTNIICADYSTPTQVTENSSDVNNFFATTKFTIEFDDVGINAEVNDFNPPYCVDVFVTKFATTTNGRSRIATDILARGYNTCEDSPRRIERGLELSY